MKRSIVMLVLTTCVTICGRVSTPKFEKDFNKLIDASNLAVVHFINYDMVPEGTEGQDLMEELEYLKEDFMDLSEDEDFEGVRFIGVDVRALPDVASDYGISELSTLLLFKDGKPFKRRGDVVKLTGIVDEQEIDDFIEEHFEDFIDALQARTTTQPITSTTQKVVTYQPYERRYYYRPYYNRTWYRPYWRRSYYRRYSHRPYYWRHGGYGRRWGRRYGRGGFGFGFGGGRGFGIGIGW